MRKYMGANNRQRALKCFDLKTHARLMEKIYRLSARSDNLSQAIFWKDMGRGKK
jgi:hypothetical protein